MLQICANRVESLRRMSPSEVHSTAARAGQRVAIKLDCLGEEHEGAYQRWQNSHPEFNDPEVKKLLALGSVDLLANNLRAISKLGEGGLTLVIQPFETVLFDPSDQKPKR